MRKLLLTLLTATLVVALAGPGMAAQWEFVASSGFTASAAQMQDHQRVIINDIAVDYNGNIFFTANNSNNDGVSGGITVIKSDGSTIDVDVNAGGYPGSVTKLILAGEGSVYGLQNWLEIDYNYDTGVDCRILRFDLAGDQVNIARVHQEDTAGAWETPYNRIQGFERGGDGRLYFTKNGQSSAGKYNFFFRFDVFTDVLEPSPMNGTTNNGWSEGHAFFDLEYVGDDWFLVIKSSGGEWYTTAMAWEDYRRATSEWKSDPGWGRDHMIDSCWDKVNNIVWPAVRGGSNRMIASRWHGDAANSGMVTIPANSGDTTDPAPGITKSEMWHIDADADLGGNRWMTSCAAHPTAGGMWWGAAGETGYNFYLRGHVIGTDQWGANNDEGEPESGADVVALYFPEELADGQTPGALVTTYNLSNGAYSVYKTTDGSYVPNEGEMPDPTATPTDDPSEPTATPTQPESSCDNDIDGDSVCDEQEFAHGSGMTAAADKGSQILDDSDGDGLKDGVEDLNFSGGQDTGETNMRDYDSDDDQFEDGIEVLLGQNPLTADTGFTDSDSDGLPDSQDPNSSNADTDGDKIDDGFEAAYYQDASAADDDTTTPGLGDANGDGSINNLDALVCQSLFLQNISHSDSVWNSGSASHNGFRYMDINRDAMVNNLDALVIQSVFLGNHGSLPLR